MRTLTNGMPLMDIARSRSPSISELRHDLAKIIRQIGAGNSAISPNQIWEVLTQHASVVPPFHLFIKHPKFVSQSSDVDRNYGFLIVTSLSFSISGGTVRHFQTPLDCYQKLKAEENHVQMRSHDYVVTSRSRKFKEYKNTVRQIVRTVRLYYRSFIEPMMLSNSATTLRRQLQSAHGNFKPYDLAAAIVQYIPSVSTAILSPTGKDLNGNHYQIVREYGDVPLSGYSHFCRAVEEHSPLLRTTVNRIDLPNGGALNYTVTPYQSAALLAENSPPQLLVIHCARENVPKIAVEFCKSALEYYAARSIQVMQVKLLQEIETGRRRLRQEIQAGTLQDHMGRLDAIRTHVSPVLTKILDATPAHSITVRLYNPFTESLELFAHAVEPTARYQATEEEVRITIGEQGNSVNAFAFLRRSPNHPVQIDDMNRPLPAILESEGLVGPIHNPRNSKSEICIPIWCESLPTGTLNIESDRRRGLSDYSVFFETVARMLGGLIETTSTTIAPGAVAQLARSHELAHASAADPTVFKKLTETGQVPEVLLPVLDGWMKFQANYRSPETTLLNNEERVNFNFRDLFISRIKRALPPFNVQDFDFEKIDCEPHTATATEITAVRFVVDTLLGNAERHSSLMSDTLRIWSTRLPDSHGQVINIYYKSVEGKIKSSLLSAFGLLPIVQFDRVSYGVFLMANHIRSLAGDFYINNYSPSEPSDYVPLEVRIRLPLRGEQVR